MKVRRIEPSAPRPAWADAVAGAGLAATWGEVVALARGAGFEHSLWELGPEQAPRALASVHVVRGVDLARYIGGATAAVMAPLASIGLRPLALDIAFCELPLLHLPGLMCHPEAGDEERVTAWRALLEATRANLDVDLFVARVHPDAPEARAGDLPLVPFLPNYVLPLPPADRESWLAGLPKDSRRAVRRDARRLAEGGGHLEICESDLPPGEHLLALYHETTARRMAAGDLAHPVEVTAPLLDAFADLPPGDRALIRVTVGGEMVAFSLALRAGPLLLLRTCGIDRERASPVNGYFQIDYGAIELARRWGCTHVDMGPTTPGPKTRLGAEPRPTAYLADFRSLLLRPLRSLVARRFSAEAASA